MATRRRIATTAEPEEDDTPVTPRMPQHEEAHEEAHAAPRGRTRRRKSSIQEDIFYIPKDEIPEGSSYEWKRFTVMGQEDPFYLAQMREQGWEPVDPRKHPNWVPPGYREPHIIKGGQILMERPIELTREAERENRMLAKRQVREAEQRLGLTPRIDGQDTAERMRPQVTKEYGRMLPQAIDEG